MRVLDKMPCRISEGPQEPGDEHEPEDSTDWDSQNKADRLNEALEDIARTPLEDVEARVRATRDNGV